MISNLTLFIAAILFSVTSHGQGIVKTLAHFGIKKIKHSFMESYLPSHPTSYQNKIQCYEDLENVYYGNVGDDQHRHVICIYL